MIILHLWSRPWNFFTEKLNTIILTIIHVCSVDCTKISWNSIRDECKNLFKRTTLNRDQGNTLIKKWTKQRYEANKYNLVLYCIVLYCIVLYALHLFACLPFILNHHIFIVFVFILHDCLYLAETLRNSYGKRNHKICFGIKFAYLKVITQLKLYPHISIN